MSAFSENIGADTEIDSDFGQAYGNNTVSSTLNIAYTAGVSASYELEGTGTLTAVQEYVGLEGVGTFTQTAGSNTATNGVFLGYDTTATGAYNLGGTGTLAASDEYVGYSGAGTFTQTGSSTNTLSGELYISASAGSSGSYDLGSADPSGDTGSPSLSASAEYVGYQDTGTFTQEAGTNTTGSLVVGGGFLSTAFQGSSSYTLSGGTLTAATEQIAQNGNGAFTQSDGVNNAGDLEMVPGANLTASYELDGGSLNATTETISANYNVSNSLSILTQTDGANVVTGTLTVTGNNSDYQLEGGTLNASTENVVVGGKFIQYSGVNTVGDLKIENPDPNGNGAYYLIAGQVNATNESIGGDGIAGFFSQTYGTNAVSNTLDVNNGGEYIMNDTIGGTVNAANETIGVNGTGTFIQESGSTNNAGNLTIGAGGVYQSSGGEALVNTMTIASGGSFQGTEGVIAALTGAGTVVNNGTITGSVGIETTGGLTNNGAISLTGGESLFVGPVTNNSGHTITMTQTNALYYGDVVNNGTIKVTNSTAQFANISGSGALNFDPSTVTAGIIDLQLHASLTQDGGTLTATQIIMEKGSNLLTLDMGVITTGELDIMGGAGDVTLTLNTGSIYAGLFQLENDNLALLGDITATEGANIYYDPTLMQNAYLNDSSYLLQGGGMLEAEAVPEPSSWALLVAGITFLATLHRKVAKARNR